MVYPKNLYKIHISNFRSIIELSLEIKSNYIVFTGENSSGKSNILKALSYLYHTGHKLSNNERYLLYNNPEKPIIISTLFKDTIKENILNIENINNRSSLKSKIRHRCIYIYISPTLLLSSKDTGIEYTDPYALRLKNRLNTIIKDSYETKKYHYDQKLFDTLYDLDSPFGEMGSFIIANKYANRSVNIIPMVSQGLGIQKKNLIKRILDEMIHETIIPAIQYKKKHVSVVVGIDEPENSLHPKLQQEIASLLQDPKYHYITFLIATHSYNFLNFKHPDSNYLVSMNEKQTVIKACDINNPMHFNELCTKLGFPISTEISDILYQTKNIFLVEGTTDKQHIENCISLFENELNSFDNYTIISAGGADETANIANALNKIGKKYRGIVDNDDKGISCVKKTDHSIHKLPNKQEYSQMTSFIDSAFPDLKKIDMEDFLGIDSSIINNAPKIIETKEKRVAALKREDEKEVYDLGNTLKGLKKAVWKEYLTNLCESNPQEARQYYNRLKVFLKYIMRIEK